MFSDLNPPDGGWSQNPMLTLIWPYVSDPPTKSVNTLPLCGLIVHSPFVKVFGPCNGMTDKDVSPLKDVFIELLIGYF